jgi:hypothetical protein
MTSTPPEINSNVNTLPHPTIPTGASCDPGSGLTAWTNTFENIQCCDTSKGNWILNDIDGNNHLVTHETQVRTPRISGSGRGKQSAFSRKNSSLD